MVERMGRKGLKRKKRTRGLFSRLRRGHLKYNAADLNKMLGWGTTWLKGKFKQDEPSGSWTKFWFRFQMRRRVKELRRHARQRRWKVRATKVVREKGGKRKEKVTVPVPRFRLGWPLISFGSKQLKVALKLNPSKTIPVDRLDYKDFRRKAIPYKRTSKKRKKALQRWLEDRNYEFTWSKRKRLHIRLEGKRSKPGFLKFDGNNLKQGIIKNPFPQFKGKKINSSSDLPEGYFLGERRSGAIFVSLKPPAKKHGLKRLGLDRNSQLIEGPGEVKPLPIAKISKYTVEQEDYDVTAAVDNWFKKDGTVKVGYKDEAKKATWLKRIKGKRDLRRRPKHVSADLGYIVNARRDSDILYKLYIPEMKRGDDKGHLVARRFDGPDVYKNVIPMKQSLNRFPGRWYAMENRLAKVYTTKKGKHYPQYRVSIDISVRYKDKSTRRPSGFTVVSSLLNVKTKGKTDKKSEPLTN
jgi:hypothetical protein